MKNRLLTFAGVLALLAVMGKFYAVPLLAQVRAAIVQNLDERGRNPYTALLPCYSASTNSCTAFFPAVPANTELVIEHISMSVDTPTALSNVDFYGNAAQASPLLTLQGADSAGNSIYIANQPLLAYFSAGQTPSIAVFAKSAAFEFVSGSVTLTGYTVNLAQ
jgi:hypothetical protein